MTAEMYIQITTNLREQLAAKLKPHQEKLHEDVLAAEVLYQQKMEAPPPSLNSVSHIAKDSVRESLIAYLYKWRTEDAERELSGSIKVAQQEYDILTLAHVEWYDSEVKKLTDV